MNESDKPEVETTGQVAREIQRQGGLADELREVVGKLKERLASVTQERPKDEPTAASERATVVTLAGQIEGINDSTACSIKMLVDLWKSIEL